MVWHASTGDRTFTGPFGLMLTEGIRRTGDELHEIDEEFEIGIQGFDAEFAQGGRDTPLPSDCRSHFVGFTQRLRLTVKPVAPVAWGENEARHNNPNRL